MDKIVVNLDTDQRLCVSCGFSEDRPGEPAATGPADNPAPVREVPTRVSRAAARRVETPAQPITIIDPGKPDTSATDPAD